MLRTAARLALSGEAPRGRVATAVRPRAAAPRARRAATSRELPPGIATLGHAAARARLPRRAEGQVAPLQAAERRRAGAPADAARVERDYGFADWEPAGRRRRRQGRRRSAAARAGTTRAGLGRGLHAADGALARAGGPARAVLPRLLARQPARRARLPVVLRGGRLRAAATFDDLRVPLPPTLDEDLRDKPTVQALMKLGPDVLPRRAARPRASSSATSTSTRTCTAWWTRRSAGCSTALGDPGDPDSLRSRTVIVRTSDHGEMGLSHGGLRQKMFNAYEESHPRAARRLEPARCSPSRARATRWSRSSTSCRRCSAWPAAPARPAGASTATTSARCCAASATRSATRCCSPTTTTRPARRSRRRRASRTGSAACATQRWKYAVYLDPTGARRARVRALRPRGRSRRGAEPRRQGHRVAAHGPGPARGAAAARACSSARARASGTLTPPLPPAPGGCAGRLASPGARRSGHRADHRPGRARERPRSAPDGRGEGRALPARPDPPGHRVGRPADLRAGRPHRPRLGRDRHRPADVDHLLGRQPHDGPGRPGAHPARPAVHRRAGSRSRSSTRPRAPPRSPRAPPRAGSRPRCGPASTASSASG